jgi:ribose 5-phosphate isomerase B
MCRRHNDANVICVAGRMDAPEAIERYVDRFLATGFDGGRHQNRIDKLRLIEQGKL